MTKQELVERVHEVAGEGLSRKRTGEVVDAIFKTIVQSVQDDGKFFHPGFGTFVVRERKARMGRNPRTGEPMNIAGSRTVTFKAAQQLRDSVG
jgi:nucleoid DNA-binding protein